MICDRAVDTPEEIKLTESVLQILSIEKITNRTNEHLAVLGRFMQRFRLFTQMTRPDNPSRFSPQDFNVTMRYMRFLAVDTGSEIIT